MKQVSCNLLKPVTTHIGLLEGALSLLYNRFERRESSGGAHETRSLLGPYKPNFLFRDVSKRLQDHFCCVLKLNIIIEAQAFLTKPYKNSLEHSSNIITP